MNVEQILSRAGLSNLREDNADFDFSRDEGGWAIKANGFYTEGELEWLLRALREVNREYNAGNRFTPFRIVRADEIPGVSGIDERNYPEYSEINGIEYRVFRDEAGDVKAVWAAYGADEGEEFGIANEDAKGTNAVQFIRDSGFAEKFGLV